MDTQLVKCQYSLSSGLYGTFLITGKLLVLGPLNTILEGGHVLPKVDAPLPKYLTGGDSIFSQPTYYGTRTVINTKLINHYTITAPSKKAGSSELTLTIMLNSGHSIDVMFLDDFSLSLLENVLLACMDGSSIKHILEEQSRQEQKQKQSDKD